MRYLLWIFFLLIAADCLADDYVLDEGLPVVWIETVNGEMPTATKVTHPDVEGAHGTSITNATKVPGSIKITFKGETLYDSGDYADSKSGMTMKLRGNTSVFYSGKKKPFKVKLEKKNDLLCRGDNDKYADKNWVLLPMTGKGLNNIVGLKVNELIGMQYTPAYKMVNVVINDEFYGLYTLIEQVRRNADCRLNVDKNTGYIIECDPYWWNEDLYFKTNTLGKFFTFKYPESEDITDEQLEFITGYMEAFEQSVVDCTYEDYIDIESWTKWMLGHDILGTYDAAGSNIFVTKYDDAPESKLMMGNLWDFDTIEKTEDRWANIHGYGWFYFKDLFSDKQQTFARKYVEMYESLEPWLFDEIDKWLKSYRKSEEGQAVKRSLKEDYRKWQYTEVVFDDHIADHREWFKQRREWMNDKVDDLVTGIKYMGIEVGDDETYYNMQGMRLKGSPTARGIYIKGGKKIFVR